MSKYKPNLAAMLAKLRKEKALTTVPSKPIVTTPKPIDPIVEAINKDLAPIEALRKRLAKEREQRALATGAIASPVIPVKDITPTGAPISAPIQDVAVSTGEHIDKYGNTIHYNKEQQAFVDLMAAKKSCVLIGSAGSGKTTCSQGGVQELILKNVIPLLSTGGHSHLTNGTPGILIISYTRRAVNNIRAVQTGELKHNCITSHKLLEYAPVYFDIVDPETGNLKSTMRFEPSRGEHNPLPTSIHTIIVEEASMLSVPLYREITAALSHRVQWIFIGDLNQLPPVFGPAILGYKMLDLPVIELTQIYRQALKSPIIRLAQRVLSGKAIPASEYADWEENGEHGSLKIHAWKKKISAENAANILINFFKAAYDSGTYDPNTDTILIPFNKGCGTLEVNKGVANHIARKYNRRTYEVVAGFNKHYFSVGDNVLYDKEDAVIVEISENPDYTGAKYQDSSLHLDYWGHNSKQAQELEDSFGDSLLEQDIDFLLEAAASTEDRVTQASHVITVELLRSLEAEEEDEESPTVPIKIYKAAEVNNLLHSYALTVHKAQGSEWKKVFLCLHESHASMLQRELLYTGITRAKQDLYVICEPESFTKGIERQRIKGNTLAEKAEYFKGKGDIV